MENESILSNQKLKFCKIQKKRSSLTDLPKSGDGNYKMRSKSVRWKLQVREEDSLIKKEILSKRKPLIMHILGIEKNCVMQNWFEWVFNFFLNLQHLPIKFLGSAWIWKVFTCNYTCNLHVIVDSVIFIRTKFPQNQFLGWDFFAASYSKTALVVSVKLWSFFNGRLKSVWMKI